MTAHIHPDYDYVVFRDRSAGLTLLTRSTRRGPQTVEWTDGHRYPVIDVEVSSASHPFHTGRTRILDTVGQVEKFRRRYQGGESR